MADNNGFTPVLTKGNKKKAADEKANAKKKDLEKITANVDMVLQQAIRNAKYIEDNNYGLYNKTNIGVLLSTIQAAAEAAKKTTAVADASGYLQTMIKSNEKITEVEAIVRTRVTANTERHRVERAAYEAEQANARASLKAMAQNEIYRKERYLIKLYNLLYNMYDYYTNPLARTTRDTLAYIRSQSLELKVDIDPLLHATTQDDIVKYLAVLHKKINKLYNSLIEEKKRVLGDSWQSPVRSTLDEAVLSVDHLIDTIKQVNKKAAKERAAAESAAAERAAAAEREAAARAAAEANAEARRAKYEEDYQRRLEEEARRYREERERASAAPPPPPENLHLSAYATLGIEPGANIRTITTAYRGLARVHHPDKGGNPEEFKKIKNAYNLLTSTHGGAKRLTRKSRGTRRLRKMTRKRTI